MLNPDLREFDVMPSHLGLIEPHAGLEGSYRGLRQEFLNAGEPLIPFTLTFPVDDFSSFLVRLSASSRGDGLPAGFVACSTYWLVSEGEVVGVADVRHVLTDSLRRVGGHIGYGIRPSSRRRGYATELLRLTLLQARGLGLPRVLLTCGKANLASARVIQRNGGLLDSEEFLPERNEVVQRYWIEL